MIDISSEAGQRRLAAVIAQRPLLALDFDGTVSRLVADPESARIDPAVPPLLQSLLRHLPVALVSGRGVADLHRRAGIPGVLLVGNHGNEWEEPAGDADAVRVAQGRVVQGWLDALTAPLAALGPGLAIETKTVSMSVHYRLVAEPALMRERLLALFAGLVPAPTLIEGKFVVNLLAPGLVTKYEAVVELVRRTGAGQAIFVGDDLTDEHVFERAPADWLGVRVWDAEVDRSQVRTHAGFCVDGVDGVVAMLRRIETLTNL